jgi:hypothetical protein
MRLVSSDVSAAQLLRRLGCCALAVATICATLPAPQALAVTDAQQLLLGQAYPPEPYPPGYYPPPPPPRGYRRHAGPPPMAEIERGQMEGRADAYVYTSRGLWFAAGFFLTFVGIALGYLLTPAPDGARLIGRSPGYVEGYSLAFGAEARSIQGIHAVYGCVTSGAIVLVVWILEFAVWDHAFFWY